MPNLTLKHPKALPICFLTEMWERFGYMLISSTMIFILIQRFNLSDYRSNIIVGSFAGVVYITSVLAGQIADKLIGYYRSILFGGVALIIGYTYLAIARDLFTFCVALGVICSGTGLLKTNVGSYLGQSYESDAKHRSSGFTVFYVGINVGALLGTSIAGYLYNHFGDIAIFVSSALMISIGTLSFYYGFKLYKLKIFVEKVSLSNWFNAIGLTVLGVIVSVFVIYNPGASKIFFSIVAIFSIYTCFKGVKSSYDFKKAISYLIFLVIATVFWTLYNQVFMSLNLFIDRAVNHQVLGFLVIPTQAFIAFNNITILAGGVLLAILWKRFYVLDIYKYILGMFILMFMFMLVSLGIYFSGSNTESLVNGNWVVLCYVALGLAELLVSAIGLSLATRLAPVGQVGSYMGLWLVNLGIGGFTAGIIANYSAVPEGVKDIVELKHIYQHGFNTYMGISIAAFLFTVFAAFFVKKLLGKEA